MPVAGQQVASWGPRTTPAVEWGLLCSIDSRHYFTALGEGWEDALGWTREELLSRPFTDFLHPTERDRTLTAMRSAWEGDSAAIALDTRFRMRGGRWQSVRWSPAPDRVDLAAAPARPRPRTAWRDYPLVGAALRAFVVVALICCAIGVGFLLTSFAPEDSGNPPGSGGGSGAGGHGRPDRGLRADRRCLGRHDAPAGRGGRSARALIALRPPFT